MAARSARPGDCGTAVLLVEHNVRVALQATGSDRGCVLALERTAGRVKLRQAARGDRAS